jgi:RNA polymerase sigma-70 factor, ECF subfamily
MARADDSADDTLRIRPGSWSVDINKAGAAADGPLDYATALDDALVLQISRRDVRALEAMYDRYGDIVYSVSLRVVGDVQLAEDVAQEVFLRLWRRPEQYDQSRGRFLTWLLSVARNRAIDERRSRGRRSRHESLPGMETEALFSVTSRDDPEDAALQGEEQHAVRKALLALPPEQRVAIELAYFRGYTQLEIATGLHQPLGTIKTRIRLGLQKLRQALVENTSRKSYHHGL